MMHRLTTLIAIIFLTSACSSEQDFIIKSSTPTTLICESLEAPVVRTALQMFQSDYEAVFSDKLVFENDHSATQSGSRIIVATIDQSTLLEAYKDEMSAIVGRKEAFILKVLPQGDLLIAGSDAHGTAYGILELSRLIGVSPWEWWADSTPQKRSSFKLDSDFSNTQSPDVEYRGIFINDEDWGIMPWANNTYEPGSQHKLGRMGPKTHERIFELLLRLRANSFWPAMHECTHPFFLTEGNREVAERYGIYIGSSHCEPMASSTAVEWGMRGKGDYDYVHNSANVRAFWEERLSEVAGQEIIYTLGMRGVHDGSMQGARTVEEQKAVLERVLHDQREMLSKHISSQLSNIPQAFIPYKEVLDVYNAGLSVPEDVTLMWCDDNYGYIRHFPSEEENARSGGNGIYYHVSYWGRPHDYLWLCTVNPYLIFQQMSLAYDKGVRKMWILNVGDIKPAEYQIELFMDMAWNIDAIRQSSVSTHLNSFLAREFGTKAARKLLPVMQQHYALAYVRKPEFLGNTRVEESVIRRIVVDMPWSREYIERRLESYDSIYSMVESISRGITESRRDAFFQLVQYPVQAAALMNTKMLSGQLARHQLEDWTRSDNAYKQIVSLTERYNNEKWRGIMSHRPRRLEVFNPVEHLTSDKDLPIERVPLRVWNAVQCDEKSPMVVEGLGYEQGAASIPLGTSLSYSFSDFQSDTLLFELQFLPSHPIGDDLRVAVSLDGGPSTTISIRTIGRSEEWKENVLWNRSLRSITMPVSKARSHTLTIKSLDEGVVLDQVRLYTE